MRGVIFSDIHVHTAFKQAPDHLDHCMQIIRDVFKMAKEGYADCIIFCGDLLHQPTYIPVKVLNRLLPLFDELFKTYPNIPFIAVSGNHDQAEKRLYGKPCESVLQVFDALFPNFILLDNKSIKIANSVIHGVPYYDYPEHLEKVLAEINPETVDVLLIHNTPAGISNKNIPVQVSTDILRQFKQVFVGHIHKPQQLAETITVLGCPKHNDRGDSGDIKYVYFYDTLYNRITAAPTGYPEIAAVVPSVSAERQEGVMRFEAFNPIENSPDKLIREYANTLQLSEDIINVGLQCV